jgi:hypothetical protein
MVRRPDGLDFPSPQRTFPGRVRTGSAVEGGFPAVAAPQDLAPEDVETPLQRFIPVPDTFDKLLYHLVLVNRARETPVMIEQTVAPGATGTVTVVIPANEVDVQRFFDERGDGSINYSIAVLAPGRVAVADHRITAGTHQFARFWEKTTQVIISFTNNDPVNPALLQLSWTAVRLEISKWNRIRDRFIEHSRDLGVEL